MLQIQVLFIFYLLLLDFLVPLLKLLNSLFFDLLDGFYIFLLLKLSMGQHFQLSFFVDNLLGNLLVKFGFFVLFHLNAHHFQILLKLIYLHVLEFFVHFQALFNDLKVWMTNRVIFIEIVLRSVQIVPA